ncbi:MAG: nuclear transport factor 2 family protein [Novosphingobium sp.]
MFEVADWLAIQKLLHCYPRYLDGGDLEGLGRLFADAAVHFESLDQPIVADPAAVTKMFTDFVRLYDGVPRTRHLICNVIVEPESSHRARATSTVLVVQGTPDLPLQPIITGDYRDVFEKVDGTWRYAERWITNDLFGNLSAHGKYEIGN